MPVFYGRAEVDADTRANVLAVLFSLVAAATRPVTFLVSYWRTAESVAPLINVRISAADVADDVRALVAAEIDAFDGQRDVWGRKNNLSLPALSTFVPTSHVLQKSHFSVIQLHSSNGLIMHVVRPGADSRGHCSLSTTTRTSCPRVSAGSSSSRQEYSAHTTRYSRRSSACWPDARRRPSAHYN
jgi:hypothetical protein